MKDNAPDALSALADALNRLPGVGPKTALRLAWHLLAHDREGAERLSGAITDALTKIGHCSRCNTFSEEHLCKLCAGDKRDPTVLCIVEMPSDQVRIEQTMAYHGLYYVLMGRLSPLDGDGPKELGFSRVVERACDGVVREVILATAFTAEGEATAHALSEILKAKGLKVTRLARGVPPGAELDYVDSATIAHALLERKTT